MIQYHLERSKFQKNLLKNIRTKHATIMQRFKHFSLFINLGFMNIFQSCHSVCLAELLRRNDSDYFAAYKHGNVVQEDLWFLGKKLERQPIVPISFFLDQ